MGEWAWVRRQPEGQFLERKGCYDYSGGTPKRRPARDVARNIAESLAAMANADGGTVAVGIEDDATVTGVDYSEDRLEILHRAPHNLVHPSLHVRIHEPLIEEKMVLIFEVDWSPEVHRLSDGRYLLRIQESNTPFPADQIEAIKAGKRRRLAENRVVAELSLDDLDSDLLDTLLTKTGFGRSYMEVLRHYRLVQPRNGKDVLTIAALLLFARDPLLWHPGCYVDFVKWEGTERRFGAELNVVKRERIEAPLPRLIERTFETVRPHIRERHRLVDLFFEERFEYPAFAWQEAIINAVAHRDYGLEGVPIELWLFDDRMEIRSPGLLVEPVTLDRLKNRERIHASRNPRIVRVLTDWGYMRELGEGVPRMFEVMEREGLHPPDLRLEAGSIFTVALRNVPVYPPETLRWLQQFEVQAPSANQKRLLAYAHAQGGQFTSRSYQKLVGVDIYAASRDIKDLIRKGIVRLIKKGGRAYEVVTEQQVWTRESPPEYAALEPTLKRKGFVKNEDIRRILGISTVKANRIARNLVALGWLLPEGQARGRRYVAVR
jgi:ATP-dependent DNA helicase RecG